MDGSCSMYKVGDLEYKTFLNMLKKLGKVRSRLYAAALPIVDWFLKTKICTLLLLT